MTLAPPPLSLLPIDATFAFERPTELSRWPGSAVRGVFGRALREVACLTGEPSCEGCGRTAECSYAQVFEASPGGAGGNAQGAVLPYALRVLDSSPQQLKVRLTLFGRGREHIEPVAHALEQLGNRGLGPAQARARAVGLTSRDSPLRPGGRLRAPESLPLVNGPQPQEAVTLALTTPMRLKYAGRDVPAAGLTPGLLVRAAARRLRHLAAQWGDGEPAWDHGAVARLGEGGRATGSALIDVHERRFSNRQGRATPLTGVVGRFVVCDLPADAVDLLRWASHTGLGHGTTWGQGAFDLEAS